MPDTVPMLLHADSAVRAGNEKAAPRPDDLCIHDLIEQQAAATPDAIAVLAGGREITYRELDRRANRLALVLVARGAKPDAVIGLMMERSIDLVVSLLAILKSGAAYLPLDARYPLERLKFMIEDADVPLVLTQATVIERLEQIEASARCMRVDSVDFGSGGDARPETEVAADHLAYVIYTSGSTGTPKGVMVTHRNVANFFVGMDGCIPGASRGVWLAVTSLSFDISVLELLWTLARGFKVVLHEGENAASTWSAPVRPLEFSLFYFASDEGGVGADKYRLLIEGARFADRNGFAAIWSPERHFHAFGGLYPNPSVASAAIAVLTDRVKIRAGSCVLPLHSPVRVAEEWALVDNLSGGRVGVSFASGWQPDDFVIAPQNFADRKEAMFRGIDAVRKLWRGEAIRLPGPSGKEVEVRTLPRPIQPELPVWVTAAGNPETFSQAGESGANLLTHLLGQSVDDLAEKVALYRSARQRSGHPGDGHVTLMLHCFAGEDDDAVREVVRGPMKAYLRSSVDLIRRAAWTFPPFMRRAAATGMSPAQLFDAKELSAAETEALLDHAFDRYFETSGLFGTPRTCLRMIERLRSIGIDEVACLIDFGVDPQLVLGHLEHLDELRRLADEGNATRSGILDAIEAHGVTHLQCTPSLAQLLLADGKRVHALRGLRALLLGGEACPPSLAERLLPLLSGELLNMYGPTETTIWSTTCRISGDGSVPIGRPICNTRLHVLDEQRQPVPPGLPGELFIGGAGVARGYINRPELTSERFIPDPFDPAEKGRLYRTGDLVRYREDGALEFLGRLDHQTKIRGHRVELGEIEATLARQAGVKEAIVIAQEDEPGAKRLSAFVTPMPGAELTREALRDACAVALPDFMVPSAVTVLEKMPLTPNGKVDRAALPAAARAANEDASTEATPQDPLEAKILAIWQQMLGLSRIGTAESFFALGGDSLLAIATHRRICDELKIELPIAEFFLSPSVSDLAGRIARTQIEAALEDHPSVQEAAAVNGSDGADRRIVAYVVPSTEAGMPSSQSLRAFLAGRLASYMMPSAIVGLPAIPRTSNGKLDRRRLPGPGEPNLADGDHHVEMPRDEVERALQEVWEGILGVAPIGIDDNFFDLGGQSLLAVRVFAEIRRRLGRSLPLASLFRAPTIRRLGDLILKADSASGATPLVPIGPAAQTDEPPVFVIHGLTGEVMNLQALGLELAAASRVFALRARGLDGVQSPFDRIEDMADHYLDHVRREQPHGPYRLLGFCFGGLVAFEMARRLCSAGETVSFLGLLDSAFHPRFLSPASRLRFGLAKQQIHLETLWRLPMRERGAYIRERIGKRFSRKIATGESDVEYLAYLPDVHYVTPELRAVTAAAARAFCAYEPGIYPGRLTYVRPSTRDFRNILNFASEWRAKAVGGVETIVVPGDHMTMLDAPAAHLLSERLRAAVSGTSGA